MLTVLTGNESLDILTGSPEIGVDVWDTFTETRAPVQLGKFIILNFRYFSFYVLSFFDSIDYKKSSCTLSIYLYLAWFYTNNNLHLNILPLDPYDHWPLICCYSTLWSRWICHSTQWFLYVVVNSDSTLRAIYIVVILPYDHSAFCDSTLWSLRICHFPQLLLYAKWFYPMITQYFVIPLYDFPLSCNSTQTITHFLNPFYDHWMNIVVSDSTLWSFITLHLVIASDDHSTFSGRYTFYFLPFVLKSVP